MIFVLLSQQTLFLEIESLDASHRQSPVTERTKLLKIKYASFLYIFAHLVETNRCAEQFKNVRSAFSLLALRRK